MKQHNDQLFTAISYSYSEYLNAQLSLISSSLYFSILYFDEEVYHIQEGLKDLYLSLPQLLSAQSTGKEKCTEKLLNYRSVLEYKYRSLIAYQRELTHLVTLKQQELNCDEAYLEDMGLTKEDALHMNYPQLATDCKTFVFDTSKEEIKQKHAASLLPYIPIKITKANYVEYIRKSIKHIAIQDNEESALFLVSILKQLFDGKTYEGYGKDFADLKDSVNELLTLSDLTDLFEEANMLNETIETLLQILDDMYRMICTLSNLLIFDQLEFTDITHMDISFSDLYFSLKSVLMQEDEAELILPSLKERLEERLKVHQKAFNNAKPKAQVDPYFNLMQTYLSMNLEQLFGFSMAKGTKYSYEVLAVFENFVNYLEESLATLDTKERKCRMQYLISNVPFVMSAANFETYVQRAFMNMSHPTTGLLVAMQLSNILEQEGYFPPAEQTAPVIETHLEEDDEAARFIKEHSNLFEEDTDFFDYYIDETPSPKDEE